MRAYSLFATLFAVVALLILDATPTRAGHCGHGGFGRGFYGHRQAVIVQLPPPVLSYAPPLVQAAPLDYGAAAFAADPGNCYGAALSAGYAGYPQLLSAGYAFRAGRVGLGYYGHGQFFAARSIHLRDRVSRAEVARALAIARAVRRR